VFIDKLIKIAKEPNLYRRLLSMDKSGYLYDMGWIDSYRKKISIDKEGKPLPWVTYSFMKFIDERLSSDMDIFEYGSGNSTLWYASRVKSVTSIENDMEWYRNIKERVPSNATIFYEELIYGGNYSKYIATTKKRFHIVIIDGRDRINSIKSSIEYTTDDGIIVLDDSDRVSYAEGVEFLLKSGYKKIDFWGMAPIIFYDKCTTIFYKDNNCLGI